MVEGTQTGREPRQWRQKTVGRRELKTWLRAERDSGLDVAPEAEAARPKTRADCCNGPRPCPWVGCKFNLYLDVDRRSGSIKFNHPTLDPEEMAPEGSCALDLADNGPNILQHVGHLMNVTRERVRQVEASALQKLTRAGVELAGE